MLNELLAIEQGLTVSGIPISGCHPDLVHPAKLPAVQCRLASDGSLTEIVVLPADTTQKLWTLRKGKHNSFPFIQLKKPLLSVPEEEDWQKKEAKCWKSLRGSQRRQRLRAIVAQFAAGADWMDKWPGIGLTESLKQRLTSLASLYTTDAAAWPAAVERFLAASLNGRKFLGQLAERLLIEIDEGADDWFDLIHELFTRKGPVYIDVSRNEFARDAAYPEHVSAISRVLSEADSKAQFGRCALMGQVAVLHAGSFPQPKLPILGETYIFSKNADIDAAGRYGRFATDAFPVGSELVERLGQVLRELTRDDRLGKTWRGVPNERPKPKRGMQRLPQTDLLLAFVRAAPDAAAIEFFSGEDDPGSKGAYQRAGYIRRCERVIQAIKGKVGDDFRRTPVEVCLLRKVDLGNSKAIYHRSISVDKLWDAASAWAHAEDNLPDWLRMLVPGARGEKASWKASPHLAPLRLPAVTRVQYIRGGKEKEEATGLSPRDAFSLFLNDNDAPSRLRSALHVVMARHGPLLSGSAQALRKGLEAAEKFDRIAALRSLTLLGVLLRKIGRGKETYMDETAFKLGQLLAVADTVHVGYCADRRGGEVPPALLGNSFLTMAQSSPTRALAALGRRWKPYGAWARLPETRELGQRLRSSKDANQISRGWNVIRGVSQASRAADLTRELHAHLPTFADDAFRAELLLGYIAGLPRREKIEGPPEDNHDTETEYGSSDRGTGLLVIEVRSSNPNGDPDAESEPRTLETDGRGLISPVSFKRKLRDLIGDENGPAWQGAQAALGLERNGDARHYRILEERGRDRARILAMDVNCFTKEFWDARVFGNTTLEEKMQVKGKEHFISTGVVQFGPGVSVSPIEIERLTMTKKAEAQAGKDRGMAPLGWRVVRHAVYLMPFFVNPMAAGKTRCNALDIDLLKFLMPHAYRNTASAVRPFVEIRHAWYAEHKGPLGSCPDSVILDALTPRKVKGDPEQASTCIEEYDIPVRLPERTEARLTSFEDLCQKIWD